MLHNGRIRVEEVVSRHAGLSRDSGGDCDYVCILQTVIYLWIFRVRRYLEDFGGILLFFQYYKIVSHPPTLLHSPDLSDCAICRRIISRTKLLSMSNGVMLALLVLSTFN